MHPDQSDIRSEHFKRHALLWVTVNHFLPADLLRELFATLVDVVGNGALALSDILEEELTEGPSVLRTWTVRPRAGNGSVAAYLQQLAQVLLWAGDEAASWDLNDQDHGLQTWAEPLRAAQRLASKDLGHVLPPTLEWPHDLQPLVAAWHSLVPGDGGAPPEPEDIIVQIEAQVEKPLCGVVVKHLGDLCADRDDWEQALRFYAAAPGLAAHPDPAWAVFQANFGDIVLQSLAAASWALRGPDNAVVVLQEDFAAATLETRPLLLINAKQDELVARLSDRHHFDFPGDDRPAVRAAPLLIRSQELAHAWNAWTERKYETAYRWFWAVLRRQISLGSVAATRTTKIAYGRCLVDGLVEQLTTQHNPEQFMMAVRLMLESGQAEAAAQAGWTEALLKAYLNAEVVNSVVAHVQADKGQGIERLMVVIALFERWLLLLPPGSAELPQSMLAFLAYVAKTNERSFNSAHNIAGRCLKALKRVARARPEHRRKVAAEVASAVEIHLANSDFLAISDALETLEAYFDAIEPVRMQQTLIAILDLMARIGPAASNWAIVRPALTLLASRAAKIATREVPALRSRLTATTVKFALEEGSENTRLLILLRDLDPELVAEVNPERLKAVIEDVCQRALVTNASSAPDCIYALLAAPKLVKRAGVDAALEGLQAIFRSVTGRRNSVSFPQACEALILLASRASMIARDLHLTEDEFRSALAPLFQDLLAVWSAAQKEPLIFASFQLPRATAPNKVLVHNWVFGSLGLAGWLGETETMQEALDAASVVPALAEGIAGGRAARVTAGDVDQISAGSLANESREAFYGALGSRVVSLRDLSSEARSSRLCQLLDRVFVLGPRGVDAGIFAAALDAGLGGGLPKTDPAADYLLRVSNDRDLRHSLLPLVYAVFPENVRDDSD